MYGNEAEVGEALKKCNIPRKDIFVTSKILSPGSEANETYQKCLDSIKKISGDDGYIDLMLIHNSSAGAEGIRKMWQAMEQLHQEGRLKTIGVSNFGVAHIHQMKSYAKSWPPAVNQIEVSGWHVL